MEASHTRSPSAGPFSDPINNRLLLALPQEELDRLRPNLEAVDLPLGQMLLRPNELIDYVYFPQEGMVSLVLQLEDGSVIEVGVIGREGMVGVLAPLGATAMSGEARVQMAGTALRMRAGVLRTEAARNPDLMDLLMRYVQALFFQVSQSVACNGRHPLSQSSASIAAASAVARRFMTPGITCRCWPESPARSETARRSRTGRCQPSLNGCGTS